MEARGINMQDVRNSLGVKNIRWKIKKRVLERIGHDDGNLTQGSTAFLLGILGLHEKLDGKSKMKGRENQCSIGR